MYSPLAAPKATRKVLDEFGLSTKKSLGQNFLVNDDVIRKIIELSDLESSGSHHVLEVGPGIGTLTLALLPRAAHVTSVERDESLLPVLEKTTNKWADKFTLIHKDALNLEPADFTCKSSHTPKNETCDGASANNPLSATPPTIFIANLPYAVAATLILGYFQKFESIKSATVMVQREVADRICATPGNKNYGAYTVKLGMHARPVKKFIVGPNNFFPPPHIDSAVVRLDRTTPKNAQGRPLSPAEVQATCKMADAAFFSRRKTILNSVKAYLANTREPENQNARKPEHKNTNSREPETKTKTTNTRTLKNTDTNKTTITQAENLQQMFSQANIDPKRRGETLTQLEFIQLSNIFNQLF